MDPLKFIDGYKTYIAAAGLFGLAIFQFSQKDYTSAYQSFLAALTAAGIRNAISKVSS